LRRSRQEIEPEIRGTDRIGLLHDQRASSREAAPEKVKAIIRASNP
jgi:hypothetical protein